MARYEISYTGKYLKELKLARKRGYDIGKLNDVVAMLADGQPLPEQYRNHLLQGDYRGLWECHISPDWLLIYDREDGIRLITLQRTGTHADLFGKKKH